VPSKAVLEQKQQFVKELADKIKSSKIGVLVEYKGINVADDTKLRKELREAGVDYSVVKNTLLKRALAEASISGLDNLLEETTALALSPEDLISAPKILYKQVESSNGLFKIKGGFIDGQAVDVNTIIEYAKLPSQEVLISKLLFMLQSPIQRFAIAINEIAKKSGDAA